MAHGHGPSSEKRLAVTLALVVGYMLAEVVGGLLSGSLALLADAGHMLSDAGALGLSLAAVRIARRPATAERTYGYHRAEVLAALLNAAALLAIAGWIVAEAATRFAEPPEVQAPLMMAIASGGLLVNLVALWLLRPARSTSLNLRGAWLHVLTDALGSVQALAAGALIWTLGWHWADPLASILIAVLVLVSAWPLLRDSVGVLMEGAPAHIDTAEIRRALSAQEGVVDVHDLHVWTIASGREALSAHLVVEGRPHGQVLEEVGHALERRFGIAHSTLQLEEEVCPKGEACA